MQHATTTNITATATTLHHLQNTTLDWLHCIALQQQLQLQLQLPLHYSLHYTTLHYSLHYTTLHYTTLHGTTLQLQLPYTTLHWTTLRYTTLHCTTLHDITLQYATLITAHHGYNCNRACNWTNCTTLQLQLHYTTLQLQLQLQLHYTTLHPADLVRWPLQPLQPFPKTQLRPPVGPFVVSLFTTINLSYRFPMFETSATALCGVKTWRWGFGSNILFWCSTGILCLVRRSLLALMAISKCLETMRESRKMTHVASWHHIPHTCQ